MEEDAEQDGDRKNPTFETLHNKSVFVAAKLVIFAKKNRMDCPFIDIHRHRPTGCLPQGFTFGIHPWWFDEEDYDPEQDLKRLEDMLRQDKLAAIGETGIDKLHQASLPMQIEVFEKHILLSEQYQKSLIIHNVRGNDVLMRLHKKHKPAQKWIIHGFNGTEEEIRQLTDKGLFLSVGTALLFKNRKIINSIKSIPLDHLFFESDMEDQEVAVVYEKASMLLQIPLELLKEKIFANFAQLNIDLWKTGETEPVCSSATMALIDLGRATC